jgi:hypothetical protein
MERFLYRLGESLYRDQVVLKGALMFVVWNATHSRATRDIDLLGRRPNDLADLAGMVKDILKQKVEPDGIEFDSASIRAERVQEDADYHGARIRFVSRLEKARVHMQIDFGFGDAVTPSAKLVKYPTLLKMPAPQIAGYPPETVVAEKFEAMVHLGLLNSRLKDFYDLWLLARQFDFEGPVLQKAVQATFKRRGTAILENPTALSSTFAESPEKLAQWRAFISRSRLKTAVPDLQVLVADLRHFLLPLAENRKTPFDQVWKAPGPWKPIRK